jgi:hypothetical protein
MLCERNILFLFELYIFYQNIIKVHTIHFNTFKGKDCDRRETAKKEKRYSERVVIEERENERCNA